MIMGTIVSHIVAAGERNEIGGNNKLLWHLPNDLKFFKNTTWGMPVIMGRKTYESIAAEPLSGRINIVVTGKKNYNPEKDGVKVSSSVSEAMGAGNGKGLVVAGSIEEAIEKARETDCREVFIAGGGEIYRSAMPLTHRIYLTRVHAVFPGAEVFYPEIRHDGVWKRVSIQMFPADEKHAFAYSFETWEKTDVR